MKLMEADKPPLKRARSKRSAKVSYGFGDASGSGFGATIQIGKDITNMDSGIWRSLRKRPPTGENLTT
jgi:hypothetical protein